MRFPQAPQDRDQLPRHDHPVPARGLHPLDEARGLLLGVGGAGRLFKCASTRSCRRASSSAWSVFGVFIVRVPFGRSLCETPDPAPPLLVRIRHLPGVWARTTAAMRRSASPHLRSAAPADEPVGRSPPPLRTRQPSPPDRRRNRRSGAKRQAATHTPRHIGPESDHR